MSISASATMGGFSDVLISWLSKRIAMVEQIYNSLVKTQKIRIKSILTPRDISLENLGNKAWQRP